MRKKWLGVVMACTLLAGGLTACGSNIESVDDEQGADTPAEAGGSQEPGNGEGGSETPENEGSDNTADMEWDEDPVDVNWYIWNAGGTCTEAGVAAVEDALNEITLKKINVHVNLEVLEMGSYLSQMPMQVSAGDKIDLITTFPAASGAYTPMVNNGQLLPLNDLLAENAPEMLEAVPESLFQATTVNGQIYAVPVYTDQTNDLYWSCRESLLTEAGFKAEDLKDYKDITKVFAAVYEKHPDMKMISTGAQNLIGSAGILFTGATFDTLGTDIAAVMVENEGEEAKVVCIYETQEYKDCIAVLNEWYQAGYIDKDATIREDDPTSDKNVFSWFLAGNNGRTLSGDTLAGEPVAHVKLAEGCVTTGVETILTMAIPTSATEPEAAAKVMNLCYTDPELKLLVSYGFEGENYEVAENGGISVITGSNYAINAVGLFGNVFLAPPTTENIEQGYDMTKVDQSTLNYSPLLGFFVQTDTISTEVAQLSTVTEEYKKAIECGMSDEATYQEFLNKMKDSGLEKYLEEIQRQLDDWLAQQ